MSINAADCFTNSGCVCGTSPAGVYNGHDVVAVAAGDAHSLFIKDTGALYAMGLNADGQLVQLHRCDGRFDLTHTKIVAQKLQTADSLSKVIAMIQPSGVTLSAGLPPKYPPKNAPPCGVAALISKSKPFGDGGFGNTVFAMSAIFPTMCNISITTR